MLNRIQKLEARNLIVEIEVYITKPRSKRVWIRRVEASWRRLNIYVTLRVKTGILTWCMLFKK
jgi:hypothetical protein